MHRYDAGQTSFSPNMIPRTAPPIAAKWEIAAGDQGELLSSPVVDDGTHTLYFVKTMRGNDELHSVDSVSGASNWVRKLDGIRDVYGSYPTGVILADGSILTVDRTGVYRFAVNGTLLWKSETETVLTPDLIVTPTGLVIVALELCAPFDRRRPRKRRQVRSPAAGSYSYFALRVEDGSVAWGILLPESIANFCSTAVLGPASVPAPSDSLRVAGVDGALWVTTSTLSDASYWFAINFNSSSCWVAANGTFPQIGNPDISDWMNVVLPAAPGYASTVLLPYFMGDESCWPECPPAGVIVSVHPDNSSHSEVSNIPAAMCDRLGECGGWSIGTSGAAASPRVFVLASTGLLYAFAPSDFTAPLWSANVSNAPAYDVPPLWMPAVSDGAGNVYVAWGDLIVAVDPSGLELWRFTLPNGGVSESQPAYGSDARIYAAYVREAATPGGDPTMFIGAF